MDSISKGRVSDWMDDFEFIQEASERAYLKRMALATVLNYVSRSMSTMQFRFKDGKKTIPSDWEYILNVRPNKDMSATDFWQKATYKLIADNELLIIKTDDNQLLIAEDFTRKESAVYEDIFSNVMVKDYIFKRTFTMSKVIYLQFSNEKLDRFTNDLFKDYGELFGRVLEVSMRNNQIRGSVSINKTGSFNSEKDKSGSTTSEKLQRFIDKVYASFKNSSVAIVPKIEGFDYEEYTNKMGVNNQKLDELEDMKKSLINDVAKAVGVPPALIHGEMADLDSNLKAFRLFTKQFTKKIQDEAQNKFLLKHEYTAGKRIQVVGVMTPDIFDLANSIDKLVSSGSFSPNDVLEETGRERIDDPLMDKHYITKNYTSREEELKGGEE